MLIAERHLRRHDRAGRSDDFQRLRHHDQVRHRDEIAKLGLYLGVQQVHLGDPAGQVTDGDEVAGPRTADDLQHDAREDVADERRR